MKDYIGQELNKGDRVIVSSEHGSEFVGGELRIIDFKPQKDGDYVELEITYPGHGTYKRTMKKMTKKLINIQPNIDIINNK